MAKGRVEGREDEIWFCLACERHGNSANDLLRQGCEGKPERFVPASDLDALRTERDELKAELAEEREALHLAIATNRRMLDNDQRAGEAAEAQAQRYRSALNRIAYSELGKGGEAHAIAIAKEALKGSDE